MGTDGAKMDVADGVVSPWAKLRTGGRLADDRSALWKMLRCCLLTEHGWWQRSSSTGGLDERAPAEISVAVVDFLPGRSALTFERLSSGFFG
jgi:hypothetical protein